MGGRGLRTRARAQPFEELGAAVEERWLADDFDPAALPAIAEHALVEARLHETLDPLEPVRWLSSRRRLPRQVLDSDFSDLQVQLFSTERFRIEALYWCDRTPSVHQHAFEGAFQVLGGSTIHVEREFHVHERVNLELSVGRLETKHIELLSVGDVRRIRAGADFIHSNFHLESPSVSLVVRSHGHPRSLPQYSYLQPAAGLGIAYDPFLRVDGLARKCSAVSLLARLEHPAFGDVLGEALRSSDAYGFARLVQLAGERAKGPRGLARIAEIAEGARDRFGELVDVMLAVIAERQRLKAIAARRADTVDPDLRFYLAVLLNVRDRGHVLDLVARRYPGRAPAALVDRWAALNARRRRLRRRAAPA